MSTFTVEELDNVLPTLSSDGWVTNEHLIMRKLFMYYLTGYHNQSNFFRGMVPTLKEALMNTSRDAGLITIKDTIRTQLINLYGIYFPTSDMKVELEVEYNRATELYELTINISLKTSSGESLSLDTEIIANNGGGITNMPFIRNNIINNESNFK